MKTLFPEPFGTLNSGICSNLMKPYFCYDSLPGIKELCKILFIAQRTRKAGNYFPSQNAEQLLLGIGFLSCGKRKDVQARCFTVNQTQIPDAPADAA